MAVMTGPYCLLLSQLILMGAFVSDCSTCNVEADCAYDAICKGSHQTYAKHGHHVWSQGNYRHVMCENCLWSNGV